MTRRQILYMILSFALTIVCVLVLIVLLLVFDKPTVEFVYQEQEQVSAVEKARKKGKYEGKEKTAVKLVKAYEVEALVEKDKPKEEDAKTTIGQLVSGGFVEKNFRTSTLEGARWDARFLKKSYYFVSYRAMDGLVAVGPTWLVDVKKDRVLPKNVMATAMFDPNNVDPKDYFDREEQVVRAIANHTFESGVNLGGVMLIHFSNLKSRQEEDRILGWTVLHDYGDIYNAFFQWIEDGELTYAEFEFDYGKKALRGKNLQASNLMVEGQAFEATKQVGILPTTYNPDAEKPGDRWTGASRKACGQRKYRSQCRALATILQDRELIGAMQWLLTNTADTAEDFEECKEQRRCRWKPTEKEDGVFTIEYEYDLEGKGKVDETRRVVWDVHIKEKRIIPKATLSDMAYRAVHPRSELMDEEPGS